MKPSARLYRSSHDRMFAGVCGGIGEFFGISAGVVRAAFLLFTVLSSGGAVIVYALLGMMLPGEPLDVWKARHMPEEPPAEAD